MDTKSSNPVRAMLALAVLAALSAVHDASAVPQFGTLSAPTRLASGDVVVGPLPMATPVHVVLGLKLRNHAALEAFVKEGTDAVAAGDLPHLMSNNEALGRYAPTQAQAQTVVNYLVAHGFRNVVVSPSRLLVSADGTAQTASEAFMTSLAQVRTKDGGFARANTDAVRIPGVLRDTVDSVLGLQTVHAPRSFAERSGSGARTQAVTGHSPVDFPSIYYAGTTPMEFSPIVGIVTDGDLTQTIADLNAYTDSKGLPRAVTRTVNTNGANGTSGDTTHTQMWDLASQGIVGMFSGVDDSTSVLAFYNVPSLSNADLTADFDTIRTTSPFPDLNVNIIDVSVGECETDVASGTGDGSAAADDAILLLAAAQGQTFAVAAGDTGADACGNGTNTPNYPASSPWVVAVGGTRLGTTGTVWGSESAWTDSGGSPSTFEPMPAWQTAFGVPGTMRGVPDVAFDADPNSGAQIVVNGAMSQHGGTALSAALFAGEWARVLGSHPYTYDYFGIAGPMIYRLPATAFHDVAAGTNSGGESGIGYGAAPGYDFASGRGSLKIAPAVAYAGGLKRQLIYDTGFESFTSKVWTLLPSSDLIWTGSDEAHTGARVAELGRDHASKINKIQQWVTIPAGYTLASLRFWLAIWSQGGTPGANTLSVDVYDTSSNLLGHLGTFTDQGATDTPTWVHEGFDMSRFIGQRVIVRFTSDCTGYPDIRTEFRLDDITLTVE